jgi:hypothetical protein
MTSSHRSLVKCRPDPPFSNRAPGRRVDEARRRREGMGALVRVRSDNDHPACASVEMSFERRCSKLRRHDPERRAAGATIRRLALSHSSVLCQHWFLRSIDQRVSAVSAARVRRNCARPAARGVGAAGRPAAHRAAVQTDLRSHDPFSRPRPRSVRARPWPHTAARRQSPPAPRDPAPRPIRRCPPRSSAHSAWPRPAAQQVSARPRGRIA